MISHDENERRLPRWIGGIRNEWKKMERRESRNVQKMRSKRTKGNKEKRKCQQNGTEEAVIDTFLTIGISFFSGDRLVLLLEWPPCP